MDETLSKGAYRILFMNTLAFTLCFAVWMMNGVLVTFLVENQVFKWGAIEIGWLIGIPVLTGALFRLPAGILTDKFGGKPVFTLLLILAAIPTFLLSQVNSFSGFVLCSFGFGIVGSGFAIGIAFTSVWFPKNRQGLALGILGAGNAGAALTTLFAPTLLNHLTKNGTEIENWRYLPMLYSAVLIFTALLFFIFTKNKKPSSSNKTIIGLLQPLKSIRVWRFGLYYFLVFGCFVAFSQWLIPYLVNVYYLPLVTAGFIAAMFSFPSGVIRAFGGWLADKYGARKVMYWVLGSSVALSLLLIVPQMDIYSPGKGIMSKQNGTITEIADNYIKIDNTIYEYKAKPIENNNFINGSFIFPKKETWQEPSQKIGDKILKKQLISKGVTRIFFQANVWVFAFLAIIIGIIWGIGKAAVYKHIPDYFPNEVGVVGGMVGVIGGLGGFFCPIIFGYLLEWTGLWTSSWMLILLLSVLSLWWMFRVIKRMMFDEHPEIMRKIDHNK